MTKTIIATLVASLMGLAAASAAVSPPASQHPSFAPADVIQVQSATGGSDGRGRPDSRGRSEGRGRDDGDGRKYKAGGRYDSAPSHYRRHHKRPHDWHRRGCILVGPIWFCP